MNRNEAEKEPPMMAVSLSPHHNDPAVTQAFIKLIARIKHILDSGITKNENFDLIESSPFNIDLDWIKENLKNPGDEGDFLMHFAGQVAGQFERVGIATDNLAAIKILAQRLKTGYETISSLARTISICAVTINYTVDPKATSEERVTRFAADIIAQINYARRVNSGIIHNWSPPVDDETGGTGPEHGTPEYVAALLEQEGLDVQWSKGKHRYPLAVRHGASRSEVNWNLSSRSKKIDDLGHFGWLLTSGVAHTEPWATRNLNEGSVDFYATMARAIVVPAAKSIASDLGTYFGFPVEEVIERIDQAESDFVGVISPIFVKAINQLPEDDPRRIQHESNMLETAMNLFSALDEMGLGLPEDPWTPSTDE